MPASKAPRRCRRGSRRARRPRRRRARRRRSPSARRSGSGWCRRRGAPRRSAGAAPSSGMMTLPVSAPGDVEGLGRRGQHDQPVERRPARPAASATCRWPGSTRSWWISSETSSRSWARAEVGERRGARRGSRPARRGCAASRRAAIRSRPVSAAASASRSIDVAAVAAQHQRRLDDLAAVGADDAVEGVVDRGEQDHPVAGLGEGLQAERQPGDDAVGGGDRGGVDLPAVAARHPAGDRRLVVAVVAEVAVDAVRRPRPASAAVTAGGGRKSMSATHMARPSSGGTP